MMEYSASSKELRIFTGPCWYGRIAPTLAAAFKEKGFETTCAVHKGILLMHPDAEYDVIMDFRGLKRWQIVLKGLKYSLQFLHQHNAFIFLFGDTLLPYNLDLLILKLLGKKTIMWFIGSDIRHYESLEAAAKKAGLKYYESRDQGAGFKALKSKLRMIHMVEKYVDYIITDPTIAQLLTRKYYRLYLPINIDSVAYSNISNPKPIIVHAPTNVKSKGTPYVLEAVEQLKKEGYDFEFCLFRNSPNKVVRETLSRADIVVDQLFATVPGMLAVESMAAGCAVLGGNIPQFSGFPQELPIIHTDPDNIYQNLKLLLENPELRRELGEKGRKYVEKYHDARKVANNILQLLSGNTENLTSYEPNG